MEMNKEKLREIKETLSEMKRLKSTIERDFSKYASLVQNLNDIFQNNSELEFSVRDENRQCKSMLNQIKDFNLVQKISRRLPQYELEIEDREREEVSVTRQAKEITAKSLTVQEYLSKLERGLRQQGRGN